MMECPPIIDFAYKSHIAKEEVKMDNSPMRS